MKMKRTLSLIICCLALLLSATTHFAQTRRGLTPADTLRVAGVSDAQISPAGDLVVYTVSTNNEERTGSALWLARAAPDLSRPSDLGGTARELLPANWNASSPRWSPDGRLIAFVATRDKQTGIWVVSLNERQPRLITNIRTTNFFITYAGEAFAWSPDSRRIAFINASEEESTASSTSANSDDPRVIDRIQYKSRTGFSDSLRTHVWVTDVDRPEPRQLTSGLFYDHALSWSPNGREIAFLSNRETEPEANNNSDIFVADMEGRVRQLTTTRGCEYEPQWSPNGRWIAYTATTRDVTTIDSVAEDAHVWVIDAQGGRGRELTAAQDRRARSPRWSPDSRNIFFLANDRGRTLIYRTDLQGRSQPSVFNPQTSPPVAITTDTAALLVRPFQIGGFSLSSSLTPLAAMTLSSATRPAEIWAGQVFGGPVSRLSGRVTAHNDGLVRSVELIEPEEINFKSFDGVTVQGWLMKPVGWRENQRYPLILSVHGGPHGMYGWGFNATFQAYAARGYAVLYLNPRGSNGYGQRFSDGTLREWGGGDYRDLMLGVDEALRRYSWIDAQQVGVTGGSYGGFMVNWMITQTPRFRAAVSVASVSNLVSFYATSLYQDLIHAEFGGFPWDDYDLLWRWSPLRYVRQAETPTLFLHGEQDNDVHITQAEEMYMALKRRGVETVLVRYPREGHGFREPRHRQDAMERTLAWFDRFLK